MKAEATSFFRGRNIGKIFTINSERTLEKDILFSRLIPLANERTYLLSSFAVFHARKEKFKVPRRSRVTHGAR